MFFGRPPRRFSHQVFRVFAAGLVVITALLTASSVLVQMRQMAAALADRGQALGGLLAAGARTAVFSENAELARPALSGVVERRGVLAAAVFTPDGRLLAAIGRTPALEGEARRLDPEVFALARRLGPAGECVNQVHAEVLETFCPVLIQERGVPEENLYSDERPAAEHLRQIGFVRVTIDRANLRHQISRLLLSNLVLMLTILLLGGWAAKRLSERVTRPLERLTERVRAYGAGGEIGVLPRMPADEIGRLAEAFTTMARELSEREREKDRLAEQLRHSQKMEAVGALSQGIAHDFKNILSTLKIAVYLLEQGSPGSESVLKYTGRMQLTLDRARGLVERLLVFSRTRELQPEDVDFAALLERLAPALRIALGDQVALVLETPGHPVTVHGDAASLEQLVMNLVYNARDAMPAGGELGVRLAVSAAEEGVPAKARLSVADAGAGMSPEVRARIFEPFFTTKGPGSGMGLGLSIIRGIVDEHRGRIQVESSPGQGTVFSVELPLVAPAQGQAGGAAARDVEGEA